MKKKIRLLATGVALVLTLAVGVVGGDIVPNIDPPDSGSVTPVQTTFNA